MVLTYFKSGDTSQNLITVIFKVFLEVDIHHVKLLYMIIGLNIFYFKEKGLGMAEVQL